MDRDFFISNENDITYFEYFLDMEVHLACS